MLELLEELLEETQDFKEELKKTEDCCSKRFFAISAGYSLKIKPSTTDAQLVYGHNILKGRAESAKALGLENNEFQKDYEEFMAEVKLVGKASELYDKIRENEALIREAKSLLTPEEKREIFISKAEKQRGIVTEVASSDDDEIALPH